MPKAGKDIDYSLYLVTGRDLLPAGKTYLQSLEEAIQGGVTTVQVREKDADTGEFLEIAQQTIALCAKHNIPVLINDRVDIALAAKAAGVHLGQTDMPIAVARALLPPHSIIGISCTTSEHARAAIQSSADYVGLGAVYDTSTKDVSAPGKVRGVQGIREMLGVLEGSGVRAVAIGGVKSTNLLRTLHGCSSPTGHALDGVAVVSDIVASLEPRAAAERLSSTFGAWHAVPRAPSSFSSASAGYTSARVVEAAAALLSTLRRVKPLVHQITNNVVKTQSANVTLALGGSPIMAETPVEQAELARAPGGLLINFGTIGDLAGMLEAGHHANLNGKPVVFDPVGVGATAHRRQVSRQLLNTWQATVIKGNAAEIGTLAALDEVKAQGVDSVGGFRDPAAVVRLLARQERCIVLLSGPVDYVSDGTTVLKLGNGHELLGQITGAGCILGTAVAAFCGASSMASGDLGAGTLVKGDMLIAAAAGTLALTIAAELAAGRSEVRGPGTFLPVLIDELAALTEEKILSRAKIEVEA
ncbi:thiamine biosynthetic bifunctional enzyme [Artomyces pyxidatus]|uniref:Thiamine biosynthetic bifunctional enzyme n=1 Tax=Artomyces pyxidatus TaxID=48021 RepID=A0ACB8TBU6_9AGAM|nr:thiamine biosynthetic bifunctional enzyme [Artomyces pyxidatus]